MWKGYYGKEPFDLRLAALRLAYRLPLLVAVTLLGALLTGGGYYAKNVLLRGSGYTRLPPSTGWNTPWTTWKT